LMATDSNTDEETIDDFHELDVSVGLNREVFFPGDTLLCKVSLLNTNFGESRVAQTHTNEFSSIENRDQSRKHFINENESINEHRNVQVSSVGGLSKRLNLGSCICRFISVQVWGFYHIEPSWIRLPPKHSSSQEKSTISPSPFNRNSSSNATPDRNSTEVKLPTSSSDSISETSNENAHDSSRNELLYRHVLSSLVDATETLGEHSRLLFSSGISVLDSNVILDPQQRKTYLYQMSLPFHLPPSFKSTGIKYRYFITICLQKVIRLSDYSLDPISDSEQKLSLKQNTETRLLSIGIRILNPASAIQLTASPSGFPGYNYNVFSKQLQSKQEGS